MTISYVVTTFVSVCLVLCEINASFNSGVGPYIPTVEYAIPCPDQGTDNMKFRSQKTRVPTGSGYAHRGSFSWPFEEDEVNEVMVHVEAYRMTTDWTLLTKYDGTFCNAMRICPALYESLTSAIGVNNSCPMPKGDYSFQYWTPRMSFPDIPELQYGNYKTDLQIIFNDKVQSCWRFLGEVKQNFDV